MEFNFTYWHRKNHITRKISSNVIHYLLTRWKFTLIEKVNQVIKFSIRLLYLTLCDSNIFLINYQLNSTVSFINLLCSWAIFFWFSVHVRGELNSFSIVCHRQSCYKRNNNLAYHYILSYCIDCQRFCWLHYWKNSSYAHIWTSIHIFCLFLIIY